MARYNITDQVQAAWEHYDRILTENIRQISEISNVPPEKLIKLNPAEFIEPNKFQIIDGYRYQKIEKWISRQKTDDTYLISPADAVQETANQIAYKENHISETIRASKCKVIPIPQALAMDFYIRNHRQSLPSIRATALSFGLIYKDQLVAAMTYDKSNGAVRGRLKSYELLRLAIAHGYRIHGGASKLQAACEQALIAQGETEVLSYSNATINNGKVYEALGFETAGLLQGQPFVIMRNFELIRLVSLFPFSTDRDLARAGRIKTHLGGNKRWVKKLTPKEGKP